MNILEIDFAINDIMLVPVASELKKLVAITPSPRSSNANVYRKYLQKNQKLVYSAFVGLVLEHGSGMVTMIDLGKQDKTDCSYVPEEDCERVVKEAFSKATGKTLWEAAKPAIENFHWPDKVPVLAMSTLDEVPSFFFVHNFNKSKKPQGKGFRNLKD